MTCCARRFPPVLQPLGISSQIQIIVSSEGSRGHRTLRLPPATLTTLQGMSVDSVMKPGPGSGKGQKMKLLPLIFPGDDTRRGDNRQSCDRLLSPARPSYHTRSPRSSLSRPTVDSNPMPSLSLPSSPCKGDSDRTKSNSKYHRSCIPEGISPRTFLASPVPLSRASSSSSGTVMSRSSSNSPLTSPHAPGIISVTAGEGTGSSGGGKEMKPLDADKIEQYLLENPNFLQDHVRQHVDSDTLQQWVSDRNQGVVARRQSLSRWVFGHESEKFPLFKTLATQVRRSSSESGVLWELSVCISSAVSANSFVLYLLDLESNKLRGFSTQSGTSIIDLALDYSTLASYVCQSHQPLRITRPEALKRFPKGLGLTVSPTSGNSSVNTPSSGDIPDVAKCHFILCHPIIKSDGEMIGVLELYRDGNAKEFYKEDEEIVHSYLVWGGIALHYADLNSIMNKQKKLNEFLLGVVRSIFQDMISMDAVIKKVMNFAQRLVDADRASLFLVDSRTKELYARIFDMGSDFETFNNKTSDLAIDSSVKEIRFPIGTGIAGLVATNGEILNISDAYKDERFNRGVDQVTGYVTKTILCMPVFIRSTIIGVVQMVNKHRGLFTKEDEDAFEMFAVYCGLALHHAKLYDKIRRSEQKYRVALDVLSYHNSCSEEEFKKTKAMGVPKSIPGLADFYFKPNSIDNMQKVHYAVYQFVELFGLTRFDIDSIYRFTLTVKKNYRNVPYHNWQHGFAVANCMFCILEKTKVFRPLECLALYIASLCHDLDHRGMSNKFMLESASPLASIYSTSTMEHHHFNQTVTILQQEGHNIFAKLSSEEFKQVLGNIKHCILATDLALFFTNKSRLDVLFEKDSFSWALPEHRLVAQAVTMTASDLCASAKPWDIQVETVKVIFEEFYNQGDLEKKCGRKPIPMMDRDCADELPATQVGFISGICIPCYTILTKLIPQTHPLLNGCQVNLNRWREMDEEHKHKKQNSTDRNM